jgi:non-specific serine/threonine protein kinase
VGRVAELEEIGALFETARLVTLVGPAGVGKTRLGFEFARRSLERYRDGVRLIEIAPVTQEAFFLPTVASALGLADVENRDLHARIAEELADAHVLLVLDNCERMIAPCSEFAERVLTTAGEVTILATSRESLGVPGGVVYEVRPLRVPEPEETGGPQLIEYDAVRLLCQRVAAVYPQFRLTEQNASLIGDITRRLDGIPLAIELAASHARALSPGQILEHLDDRFALLKSTSPVAVPHQRTLRGTIDWSYERLVEDEARMLRSLAVFRGHFSLEAAISVSAENADATQALAVFERLVDKSFVTTVPRADDNRYGLLESIREYLLEKLADLNEERIAQRRHLEYFALLAERLESELTTNRQSHAMALLSQENDNLRAALEWSTEDSEVREWRLRLLGALRWYYWFRGLLAEGSAYCEQILRAAPAEASRAGARALSTYGLCTLQQGAVVEAGEALERALTMYARIGEERDAVITRIHAGIAALFCNDRAAAARYLESASAETESFADDLWLRAYARGGYGVYAAVCGDRRASIEALQDSVDLSERAGETFQGTFWRLNLAIARYDEDPEAAFELFAQCAERGLEQHNERIVAGCFEGFAWCLQHAGSAELAARFLGAEQALRKRTAQALLPQWQRSHDATVRAITGTLGTARLSREIETGVQWLREAPMDALCSAAVHDFSDRIRSQAARKKRAPPRA